MKKRSKILLIGLCVVVFIYGVTFIFAKDVFEVITPFFEFPRDCGASCGG